MKNPLAAFAKRRRIIEIQKTLFNTPEGKDLLEYYCKHGFVFKSTFVVGDERQTFMNEGARRFVLSILRDLGTDLDGLKQMSERSQNDKSYTA